MKKLLAQILTVIMIITLFAVCIGQTASAEAHNVADFEHYNYQSNVGGKIAQVSGAEKSDYEAYSGNYSMMITAGGYFVVGDGTTHASVERGKKYVVSFKYFMEDPIDSDITLGMTYAKTTSYWYSPYYNAEKYVISPNVALGTWLSGSFVLDTSVIGGDSSVYLYMNISGPANKVFYIDDICVEEIPSGKVAVTVHNEVNELDNSYYITTPGAPLSISGEGSADFEFDGVYANAAYTVQAGSTAPSSDAVLYCKFIRREVNIDFESYESDMDMATYQEYAGMDFDYEVYKGTNQTKTSSTYDFENYSYTNGTGTAKVRNAEQSSDYAFKNNKSIKLDCSGNTDNQCFFAVGTGNTAARQATVTPGKNYVLTFYYLVDSALQNNVEFTVAYAKTGSRWYTPFNNPSTFKISTSTERGKWLKGKIYLDTSVIENPDSVAVYFGAAYTQKAVIYIDNINITASGDSGSLSVTGRNSMHRKGTSGLLENTMLNCKVNPLEVGEYYNLTMWVKMDKYAQQNGTVSIMRNTSGNYPWTPASCTDADEVGNIDADYIDVIAVSDLTDGKWHAVTCTFRATAKYLVLQTPGYCSIYVDDVSVMHLACTSAAETADVAATAFTQGALANPVYTAAGLASNTLDFENYTYAFGSKNIKTYIGTAASGNKYAEYSSANAASGTTENIRLADLKDNKTYKISFAYKTDAATYTEPITVNFLTADAGNITKNCTFYRDAGSKVTLGNTAGEWATATVYLTADLAYTVKDDYKADTADGFTAEYGTLLYAYLTKENAAAATVQLDSFTVTEVANLITATGVSALTDSAAQAAGSQALRYYFTYPSQNGSTVTFDGKTFNVLERGVILADGTNSNGEYVSGGFTVGAADLTTAAEKGMYVLRTTSDFGNCWSASSGNIQYSVYVKGFKPDEERFTAGRGYIILSDGMNTVTLYSDIANESVKDVISKVSVDSAATAYHRIGTTNVASYKIIVPFKSSYLVTEAANNIKNYLAARGVSVTVAYDTQTSAGTYEILIGDTNRSQSNVSSYYSGEDSYVIKVTNTKLVLNGSSYLAVNDAANTLVNMWTEYSKRGKGLTLANNYVFTSNHNAVSDKYNITFADEFEGNIINGNVWKNYAGESATHFGGTSMDGGKTATANPQDDYTIVSYPSGIQRKSFEQKNGEMCISTGCIGLNADNPSAHDFMGAQMSTIKTMNYKYGITEIRTKLAGACTLTSFWMNGDTNGARDIFPNTRRTGFTEWDLIETRGAANRMAANIHKWFNNDTCDYRHNCIEVASSDGPKVPDRQRVVGAGGTSASTYLGSTETFQNSYHILTFVWEPERIKFAVDGKVFCDVNVYDYTGTAIYNLRNFINLAAGMGSKGSWGTYVEGTSPEIDTTYIDYVRVYQTDNGAELQKNF